MPAVNSFISALPNNSIFLLKDIIFFNNGIVNIPTGGIDSVWNYDFEGDGIYYINGTITIFPISDDA